MAKKANMLQHRDAKKLKSKQDWNILRDGAEEVGIDPDELAKLDASDECCLAGSDLATGNLACADGIQVPFDVDNDGTVRGVYSATPNALTSSAEEVVLDEIDPRFSGISQYMPDRNPDSPYVEDNHYD